MVFKLWFWVHVANDVRFRNGCQEYGFFFSKVRLDGSGFVAGNVVICILILIGCFGVGVAACLKVSQDEVRCFDVTMVLQLSYGRFFVRAR